MGQNDECRDDGLHGKQECRSADSNLPDEIPAEEARRLVQELRIHQVELEMQNEELRRTQTQLEESRAQYADLYDFAPVAYLSLDERGIILRANLTAAKWLGIERARLTNSIFHSYVLEKDKDKSRLHFMAVFRARECQTCEVRLKKRGGEQFYARLESILIENADGTGQCRTSIIDITRSKHDEEALQHAHDDLEELVEGRTADLARANELLIREIAERRRAEDNLRISLAQLERSNRELQDFAYSASHDMQEPLRKIQTFCAMIQEKYVRSLDDQGRDYLERIIKAAKRMSDMVRGLLNYSRVNTQGEPFTSVELTRVVHEAAQSIGRLARETDASFEIGDLPAIEADPNQMRQLFQRLIENALKFRSERKPLIKISARHVGDPRGRGLRGGEGYYDILVEDNGIGFDERYVDRIFTLFQRLHGRSAYDGTGMGLPVCRRIVERHHGSITARSTPGTGTTFIITLPARQPG